MTFRKRILFWGDWTALFTYLGKAAGSYVRGRISGGPRHTCAGVGWKLWSWSLPWKTPYEPEKQSTESHFFVCLPLRRNFIDTMIINCKLRTAGRMFKSEVCWEIANNHAGQSTTFKSRRFFLLSCATTSKVRVYTPLKNFRPRSKLEISLNRPWKMGMLS